MDKRYSGSCLCGAIRYSVTRFSAKAAHCHCTMCRKFHGAAFATLVGCEGLQWHAGLELLTHYQGDNGTLRSFCGQCGASIGFRVPGASLDQIELAIATFEDVPEIEIDAHIYTKYKAINPASI